MQREMWSEMRSALRSEAWGQVRRPMRGQVRDQMRAEELTVDVRARAARQLLDVYENLAARGAHLLDRLLVDGPPTQWERLPPDDATDGSGLFQWFYHCHAPEDRAADAEHGHFHLFARRAMWQPRTSAPAELDFRALMGEPPEGSETRHLLGVSLDAKGVPASLFAVDSSATGDAMMSGPGTLRALREMQLDTGFPEIDRTLESVVRLCDEDLHELFRLRDEALRTRGAGAIDERGSDLLAQVDIHLDRRLEDALRPARPTPRRSQGGPGRRRPAPGRAGTSSGAGGR